MPTARATPPRGAAGLLAAAASGYLLGTAPAADAAARLASKGAARVAGARRAQVGGALRRQPGGANALVVLGKGWGYGVMAVDIVKGAAACVVGRRLGGEAGAHVAGTAAVVGHCFPVWNGFRGGKGVAVSLGQCSATFPVYLPVDLGVSWAVGRWKGRTFPGTVAGSATWVVASLLWWRNRWPNGWGPEPTAALPASAAVSSAVILYKFTTARIRP